MRQRYADDLTGALARAGLVDRLAVLHRAYLATGGHFAVAMLDLDHLKTVNDVYGHAAGDTALRTVAQRAMHVLRGDDELYRYGGDEFVIVFPNTTRADAAGVMRRVRHHIVANPIQTPEWITLTISVGVAASDEAAEGTRPDDLMARADRRLYQAKRAGRNAVAAADRPKEEGGGFTETRLFARDTELAAVDAFLGSEAESAEERVLQLTGPAGAGFTRFLNEVAVRSRLAGRAVRHVVARPTHTSLHLRALELAYRDELGADASTDAVTAWLRNEAEAHGLVILLEGGQWLDSVSRRLLAERLRRGGTKLVEAAPEGTEPAFRESARLVLAPLSTKDAVAWLAAATGGSVEAATGEAIAQATHGLPSRLTRMVRALLEDGTLARGPEGLLGDPRQIATRAAGLSVGAVTPPVNLPAWDTPLVGRSRFIELTVPGVRAARLVVLTGPGGTGKSRLAAQLGLELATDAQGGTDWVDLRAVDRSEDLPQAVANALGLGAIDDLAALASELAGQRRRLVIDEADGIGHDAGILGELLRLAPELRLLVTSRMPLRLPDEMAVEVPELSTFAATELFRLGMARAGAQEPVPDDEIAELLERVGLSPLAVEMAAAWMRALTPSELKAELDRQPELLVEAPGLRPRTTRLIEVSRQLMSAVEQEMLGTLALLPAGFEAAQAREAVGASPFFLLALLERTLLRREGTRYTVHAAIAERFRAGLADPAAARLRVAAAWAKLAAQVEALSRQEKNLRGYRLVDAEKPNFVFAWGQLLDPPAPAQLWPLARLMRGYLNLRGRANEGLDMFSRAATALSGSADTELRGWVYECMALYAYMLRRDGEAREHVTAALELLQDHGDSDTLAMTLGTAGSLASVSGDVDGAIAYYRRAAELRRLRGDAVGEAQAHGNVAFILADTDRTEEAAAALRSAITRHRELEHLSGLALALARLARLSRERGLAPLPEVLDTALESLAIAEQIGFPGCASLAAMQAAESLMAMERFSEAAEMFERSATWDEAQEAPDGAAQVRNRAREAREAAQEATAPRRPMSPA